MIDSLSTVTLPSTAINNIVDDYRIPRQGVIYPHDGSVHYSLDFQIIDGSQVIITAYGLDDQNIPNNHIELHKIMYSAGKPSEYKANCTPCDKNYRPAELSTVVQSVRICDINITKCKPLLLINIAGKYRLKIGAGVTTKEDILLHIEKVNSKLELGFKNI